MNWLVNSWYHPQPIRWLLAPLSWLYCLIITCRRGLYKLGLFTQHHLPVPVIIVGNISVGGTGKTPSVIWLAKTLLKAGYKPGIISRGYGGKSAHYPVLLTKHSLASQVGDEPIIISKQTACPVAVGPNRIAAAKWLLAHHDCDVIISDDGLQHYALKRDIELAIVDGNRLFGNGYCLPAGPLREKPSRLAKVDFIIYNSSITPVDFNMQLLQHAAINLADPNISKNLATFSAQDVHAVAGIGHPQRFFDQLTQQGLRIRPHAFADHHAFKIDDLNFEDDQPILMTEKDAVKCQHFANKNMWYIPIEATISGKLDHHLLNKLAGIVANG